MRFGALPSLLVLMALAVAKPTEGSPRATGRRARVRSQVGSGSGSVRILGVPACQPSAALASSLGLSWTKSTDGSRLESPFSLYGLSGTLSAVVSGDQADAEDIVLLSFEPAASGPTSAVESLEAGLGTDGWRKARSTSCDLPISNDAYSTIERYRQRSQSVLLEYQAGALQEATVQMGGELWGTFSREPPYSAPRKPSLLIATCVDVPCQDVGDLPCCDPLSKKDTFSTSLWKLDRQASSASTGTSSPNAR